MPVVIFISCKGMKEELVTQADAMGIVDSQELTRTQPIICFDGNQVVYIGECAVRDSINKILGQDLPFNTVFINVNFKNKKQLGTRALEKQKSLFSKALALTGFLKPKLMKFPEFLPYEYVKDKKDGDYIELNLNGEKFSFLCLQAAARSYKKSSFQDMAHGHYEKFIKCANWLCDGERSLLEAQVIENNSSDKHGVNAIPDAQKKNKN